MSKELIKKLSNIIKEAKDIYPDVDEKIYKKHGAKNMINKDGSLKVDKTEKNESKINEKIKGNNLNSKWVIRAWVDNMDSEDGYDEIEFTKIGLIDFINQEEEEYYGDSYDYQTEPIEYDITDEELKTAINDNVFAWVFGDTASVVSIDGKAVNESKINEISNRLSESFKFNRIVGLDKKTPKFNVGDKVKVGKEIATIEKVIPMNFSDTPTYKIKLDDGSVIDRYEEEISMAESKINEDFDSDAINIFIELVNRFQDALKNALKISRQEGKDNADYLALEKNFNTITLQDSISSNLIKYTNYLLDVKTNKALSNKLSVVKDVLNKINEYTLTQVLNYFSMSSHAVNIVIKDIYKISSPILRFKPMEVMSKLKDSPYVDTSNIDTDLIDVTVEFVKDNFDDFRHTVGCGSLGTVKVEDDTYYFSDENDNALFMIYPTSNGVRIETSIENPIDTMVEFNSVSDLRRAWKKFLSDHVDETEEDEMNEAKVNLEDEANKIGNDKKLLLKRLKDGLSVLKNEYKKEFKDYEYDFENKALHSKTSDLSLIWINNGRTSEGSISLYKNKGENKMPNVNENKMNEDESGYLNDDEIASFYKDFEIVSIDNLKKKSTIWNGEEQFYYTGDIVIKFPNADADYDEFAWEETYDDFIAHKEDGTKVAFDKWYPDFVYDKLSSEVTKAIQNKFPLEVKDVEGIMRIGSKGDIMYRDNKTGEYYIARNEKDRPAYNKTFGSEEELLTWAEKVGLMESKINESLDSKIKIFLTNLGKYNEGDLVGEWVELPVDDFQPILDRIGIDEEYEEWFITDYEAPFEIGEYDNIDELNEIAEAIENFDATELEVLKTYEENGYDMQTAIEKVRDNDYFYLEASNEEELAYAYIDSIGDLDSALSKEAQERYFDYEAFGRDLVLGGDYTYVQDVVDLNEFADKDTAEMVFGDYGEDRPSEEDLNKYRQWIEIYNNYDESQEEQLAEQGIEVSMTQIYVDNVGYDVETLEQVVNEDYETKTGYQDIEGYIVEVYSERELAEYIVDGMYGSVSELGENTIQTYFDYEAFGRDLSYDFYQTDNGYVRLD